jgi:hypothetical protein
MFGTQEFHMNCAGISQESVYFHRKNAGTGKNFRVPNRALKKYVILTVKICVAFDLFHADIYCKIRYPLECLW